MNKSVAISEEFANDPADKVKSGGLLFDRRVTRVVTAGTLIDEKFMDPWEGNYLLSIHIPDLDHQVAQAGINSPKPLHVDSDARGSSSDLGLAWLDLSSGEFFVENATISSLSSVITRIGPREIVLDSRSENVLSSYVLKILKEEGHNITYCSPLQGATSVSDWSHMLQTPVPEKEASDFTSTELEAGNIILHYVTTQLQGLKIQLQPPKRRLAGEEMAIDKNSLRALEVRMTSRDGNFSGSLLHAIRRTVTKSGARLLSRRLSKYLLMTCTPTSNLTVAASPSMSLPVINQRLDLVAQLLYSPLLHESLVVLLKRTFDTLRLVQKFSFGRGDADDLLSLSKTIRVMEQVASCLQEHTENQEREGSDRSSSDQLNAGNRCIQDLLRRFTFEGPSELSTKILEAIDEEGLYEQHRIEESEAAEVAGLANEVLSKEAPGETLPGVAKMLKSKSNGDLNTERDTESDGRDVWILRQRYGGYMHVPSIHF